VVLPAGSLDKAADTVRPVIPIGEAIACRDGDTVPDLLGRIVKVRGVVTVPTGVISDAYFQVFIQDQTGGIYLFDRKVDRELVVGDIVEATGKVDQYRGATQIVSPVIEVVGTTSPPEPRKVSVAEAASWANYGRLVRVEGILGEVESRSVIIIPLRAPKSAGGGRIDVFIPRKADRSLLVADRPPGARVAIVGPVSIRSFDKPYLEGFQIILRDASDLTVLARPLPTWIHRASLLALALLAAAAVVMGAWIWHRRRTAAREREIEVVSDLSAAIATPGIETDALLDAACRAFREKGGLDAGTVHLLDTERRLLLHCSFGIPDDIAARLESEQTVVARDQGVASARSAVFDEMETRGLHLVARLPINGRTRAIGLLSLYSRRHPPSASLLPILSTAAGILGVGLDNTTLLHESAEREAELKNLTITDDLTSLYNRRFLDEYLRIQMAIAHRQHINVAFVLIDLDHFKAINDNWGHETGDRVLQQVGEVLRRESRASDLPVRLGGEEFLVVMPNTNADGVASSAARLLAALRDADFSAIDRRSDLRITASIGVAVYPDHADNPRSLLRLADEAMYRAKREGRDRVCVAGGVASSE